MLSLLNLGKFPIFSTILTAKLLRKLKKEVWPGTKHSNNFMVDCSNTLFTLTPSMKEDVSKQIKPLDSKVSDTFSTPVNILKTINYELCSTMNYWHINKSFVL